METCFAPTLRPREAGWGSGAGSVCLAHLQVVQGGAVLRPPRRWPHGSSQRPLTQTESFATPVILITLLCTVLFETHFKSGNARAWLGGCTRSATVWVYLRGGCVKEHGDLPEHACLGGRSSAQLSTLVGAGTAVAPRAKGVGAGAWTDLCF